MTPEKRAEDVVGWCRGVQTIHGWHLEQIRDMVARAIRDAVAAERERCAKVVALGFDSYTAGEEVVGFAGFCTDRIRAGYAADWWPKDAGDRLGD